MSERLAGWMHGNTITLDSPLPPLEGKRVLVRIEPADDAASQEVSAELHARLWQEWAENGPQGPIEDDGEPEFP